MWLLLDKRLIQLNAPRPSVLTCRAATRLLLGRMMLKRSLPIGFLAVVLVFVAFLCEGVHARSGLLGGQTEHVAPQAARQSA